MRNLVKPKVVGRTGYFRVVSHQRREGDRAAGVVKITASDVIPSPPSGQRWGRRLFLGSLYICLFVIPGRRFG